MSDAEFWSLTPYELDLLVQAQRRKQRRDAVPVALLVQVLCNVHRDSQQRLQPFELDEVLGWMGMTAEREPPPPPATAEELREKLRLAAQVFPRQNGPASER